MSCFLKMSWHSRHKKYRFYRERPINFHQIRRELAPSVPPHSLTYCLMLSPHPLDPHPTDLRFTKEEDLAAYLRNYEYKQGETLKIRLVDEREPPLQQEGDDDSLSVPTALTKIRSKSDDIEHTAIVLMGRESPEVTQEFLCSSGMDFCVVERNSELEALERELAANQRKSRQLQERRQLTDFGRIRAFLQSHAEREEDQQ